MRETRWRGVAGGQADLHKYVVDDAHDMMRNMYDVYHLLA